VSLATAVLESAIDDFRPDAIFCDIGMPRLDGYETARRIRAAHGHELFLIALTG
jgi:CheY-like chemotaxis protein